MSKQLQIRNSTAEFLIFQAEDKAQGVQVFYKDETIWATQKAMATLFDCSTDNIGVHLKNIFESGELQQEATTEKISVVQTEGDRQVTRQVQFYKLDAIISVGYRVNSIRATQFRQWCTAVLRQFAIRSPSAAFIRNSRIYMRRLLTIIAMHPLRASSLPKCRTRCTMPYTDKRQQS